MCLSLIDPGNLIDQPLVSVIIPCYNYGHFLGETLESVIGQSYQHWECIIVDDGSTDNTGSIAAEYKNKDSRFKYFYQPNKGTSPAKNYGLLQATGSFIQFLDADDFIAPRKLELQVSFLLSNPSIDLVYGNARYFDTNDPSKYGTSFDLSDTPWMPCVSGNGETILKPLMIFNIMVISSPLVRKRLIDQVRFFNVELKGYEDWEFWIRCALTGSYFQYDGRDEVLTFIRIHRTSSQHNELTMLEGRVKIHEILHKNNNLPTSLKKSNYSVYIDMKERIGYRLIEMGYFGKGFRQTTELMLMDRRRWWSYLINSLHFVKVYFKSKFSE